MKKVHVELAEKSFAILGLFFFTRAFDIGLTLPTGPLLPGFVTTAIRYFIWGTTCLLIGLNWKSALRIANRHKLLWILTAIGWLSFLWSDFPLKTFKDNREVLQMASFALYFATRFSLKEQVKLVAWTIAVAALVSTFFAIAMPAIAIHKDDHPGAWRGIYDHKNVLGSMMLLGSLAFFFMPTDNQRQRFYKWAGVSLTLLMMLLSTSKTSVILSFLLVMILFLYRKFKWQGRITVSFLNIALLVLGGGGLLLMSNWASFITKLGRDPTLTGRTVIWSFVLSKLEERPLFGYGRGAFWLPENQDALAAGQLLGHGLRLPHAHNGFLDCALDLGFIGLLLFLIIFFTAFIRALKLAYATKNPEDMWPLAFLIFLVMNNLTESYLMRVANIYWVLFITVVLSVKQTRQTSKLKNS